MSHIEIWYLNVQTNQTSEKLSHLTRRYKALAQVGSFMAGWAKQRAIDRTIESQANLLKDLNCQGRPVGACHPKCRTQDGQQSRLLCSASAGLVNCSEKFNEPILVVVIMLNGI
jgi:hypothetical protein